MPQGLEVFNPDGSISSSITTRLTRFLGSADIAGAYGASGSIWHPGFLTGSPFIIPRSWRGDYVGSQPVFYFYYDHIDWVAGTGGFGFTVDYGVY